MTGKPDVFKNYWKKNLPPFDTPLLCSLSPCSCLYSWHFSMWLVWLINSVINFWDIFYVVLMVFVLYTSWIVCSTGIKWEENMKLLRNSPVVCAVSIFAVQCLTILDGNLCDDMWHGNVAYASLNVYVTCSIKTRGHYGPCLLKLEWN